MNIDVAALIAIQDRSYEQAGRGIRESYPRERAMNGGLLADFLGGRRYGVLATTRPDGRAQAAPIAFTVWDGAFWVASVKGARARNLRRRPYASLVVIEGEGQTHRAVIAEGPVVLHELSGVAGPALPDELLNLWKERHGGAPTWASVLIELRPVRLFSYDATRDQP